MKQTQRGRPKRILFIMPNLNGGGAEKVIVEIINHIDKTKFKPVLYLFHDVGVLKECLAKNIGIVAALDPGQHLRLHLPKAIFRMWREAVKADLIVGGLELVPTYFAVIGKFLTGKPTIGWVHITLKEYSPAKVKYHRILCKWLYPLLSHIVTVSNGVRQELLDLLPLEPQKVTTIYNPVDVENIGRLAKEPIGYESKWPLVLAVGRLGHQKGFDVLVKAHSILIRKEIKQILVILGEGEKRKELERIVQEYGVEDSVYFPGFQKNPYAWMHKANVFVLSSRFEGFALVLVEAMAVGVPIIASNCKYGPAEILADGKYGYLVPPDNPRLLANAIKRLFVEPAAKRDAEKKVSLAKTRALDFKPSKVTPQLECLLTNILRANGDE